MIMSIRGCSAILDQVLQKQGTYFDGSQFDYVFVEYLKLFDRIFVCSLHFMLNVLDEFVVRLATRMTVSPETRVVSGVRALVPITLATVGFTTSTGVPSVSTRIGLRLLGALRWLLLRNLELFEA